MQVRAEISFLPLPKGDIAEQEAAWCQHCLPLDTPCPQKKESLGALLILGLKLWVARSNQTRLGALPPLQEHGKSHS